jgi:hypothetical protein
MNAKPKNLGYRIDADVQERLRALPHGTRQRILTALLRKALDLFDEEGDVLAYTLASGRFDIRPHEGYGPTRREDAALADPAKLPEPA